MKVLGVLLGFFCLLISAYPYCIVDDCDSNFLEQIAENKDDIEGNECGLCSPFIGCGTCIGFISSSEETSTVFNFHYINSSNLFGLLFKSVEAEYAERLWQPPKQVIIS